MTRRGFTLIELLISLALLTIVMTVAITVTFQCLTVTRRLQARQTMDASARTTYNRLRSEVTTMHPCSAVWLNAKQGKWIELVFMSAVPEPLDGLDARLEPGKMRRVYLTDQVWSRWYWDAEARTLTASTSRRGRWSRAYADPTLNKGGQDYWQITTGTKMAGLLHQDSSPYFSTLMCLPQPQRDTGIAVNDPGTPYDDRDSPVALLNSNNWNTDRNPDISIGDHQDLVLAGAARPQLINCADVSIGIRSVDGSSVVADEQHDLVWSVSGNFVDGGYLGTATDKRCGAKGNLAAGPWDQSDLGKRPGVVQLRFTLHDPKTETSSSYSFSCSPPGSTHN
jgi:prepilin-type N-terminal cleavage/methylation domain-containing protein